MRALKRYLPEQFSGAVAGFAGVTLLRALGGLAILKILALSFTPDLFGRFGQLMALVAIVTTFAGGGTTQALVQGLSSATTDKARQQQLSAAIKIFAVTGVLMSLLLVVFSVPLARFLLDREDLAWLFWVLAATHWLVGASNLIQVMLSALRRTRSIVSLQAVGIALAVLLFVVLTRMDAFYGAALGIVCFPAVIGCVGLVVGLITLPSNWRPRLIAHRPQDLRALLSFTLVVLVNICAVPVAQLLVRDMLGDSVGWNHVGYWQAILKLSDLYMQFIGMLMTYYALPRFSALGTASQLQGEIAHLRRPLMLLMLVGFLALYALRHVLIWLVFAADYAPAQAYMLPQLVGDALRILALFYVYAAMARGERLLPIMFEVLQAVMLLALSYLLLPAYQAMAPAYGYAGGGCVSLAIIYSMHRVKMRGWSRAA